MSESPKESHWEIGETRFQTLFCMWEMYICVHPHCIGGEDVGIFGEQWKIVEIFQECEGVLEVGWSQVKKL